MLLTSFLSLRRRQLMIRARPDVELIFVKRDLLYRRKGAMAKTPRPATSESAQIRCGSTLAAAVKPPWSASIPFR